MPFLVENRRIELLPDMLTHVPHGALPPLGGIMMMPVTPEAVLRISPYFNTDRQLAIYSDREIPSPDTLLVRGSIPSDAEKNMEGHKDLPCFLVENRRIELLTSALRTQRAPELCTKQPDIYNTFKNYEIRNFEKALDIAVYVL